MRQEALRRSAIVPLHVRWPVYHPLLGGGGSQAALLRFLMGQGHMDVFSLRDTVVDEYRKFATSFTTIFAEDLRAHRRIFRQE